MRREKNFIKAFGFLALLCVFGGCRYADNRPIIELPDKNRDRMNKKVFSGTNEKPKFWLSKVTVINTSFGLESVGFVFEGLQSSAKLGYFKFTRDKLQFNNIVTRQALEEPEVFSQGISELINEWDIKHFDVRLKDGLDGYPINREEESGDYTPWYKKRYFTIDWEKANISEVSTFPYISYHVEKDCWQKKTAHVIDSSREITDDYISFVIAVEYEQKPMCSNSRRRVQNNFTTTVHYKYSFKSVEDPRLPDEKNYKPYVYDGEQDLLLRKYGYFRTIRPVIAEDNRDKNIFYMSRWNPNKKHIFYFTKDYPDEYKDIAYGIICHTNKLFAKHKLSNYPLNGKCREDGSVLPDKGETCTKGICFELKENTGQEFGDIRYSFFHFLKAHIPVLGYGPMDAHPATGEIVAGNVIVSTYLLDFFLKHILQPFYKRDLEEYYDEKGELVRDNKTKYDNSSLFVRMKQTLNQNDHHLWTKETSGLIDRKSEIRPDFEYLLSQLTFGHPHLSRFTESHKTSFKLDVDEDVADIIDMPQSIIEDGQKFVDQFHENTIKTLKHERNTTIFPAEPIIRQIPAMLANGMSPEEIKKRILFFLISHEFGHVLNLKHNFYGSLDARHWHRKRDGSPLLRTSSVMDYLNLKERVQSPLKAVFGPYDEAALVYAYSDGRKDLSKQNNTHYLFCTDHHGPLNFLCNSWDKGETVSEVMMSLIENYEEKYFIRNLRLDRAYWDTRNYHLSIFGDMLNIKRALLMMTTAFTTNDMIQILAQLNRNYTEGQRVEISSLIRKDIKQAVKLSLAFYNSVLQLSQSDRDWQSEYDEESGSIESIGILWDKVLAMFFLVGDDGFMYNPNVFSDKASYLTHIDKLGFQQMIERIMENVLTIRVDMEPWFIDFGRFLYAKTAGNYYNIKDHPDLLEKIAVRCYTARGLKTLFGIDPSSYKANEDSPPVRLNTAIVPMERYLDTIIDPYYYGTNEKLGIAYFDGDYYVASSNLNKYAFAIVDNMLKKLSAGRDISLEKRDFYDMFYFYNMFKKNGVIPQSCNDGV